MPERVHKITSMRSDTPHELPPEGSVPGPTVDDGRAHGLERTIDRVLAIQRPIVVAHLRGIRRRFPNATPEQLVRILERRYLAAVTTGGAAVGATAVIPGISTGITLALSGVETAGFLESTALFAQSVAEVHGIPVDNPDRARALVMTLMLGREGSDLVRQFAAQAGGTGIARNAYWGELIANTLPKAVMSTVVDRLRSVFVKQFAVRGGVGFLGKALPFGVGAAVGGIGNHVLGRRVLEQSRQAFGRPPATLPLDLEPREGDGVLMSAGRGVARAGSVVGGLAAASARRIREAGSAVGGAVGGATRGALRRGRDGDGHDAGDAGSVVESTGDEPHSDASTAPSAIADEPRADEEERAAG